MDYCQKYSYAHLINAPSDIIVPGHPSNTFFVQLFQVQRERRDLLCDQGDLLVTFGRIYVGHNARMLQGLQALYSGRCLGDIGHRITDEYGRRLTRVGVTRGASGIEEGSLKKEGIAKILLGTS